MAYNDDLPTWGATGSKPSDGTSRSPGDNIDASEYNYLWYILNETFGDIETDVSNIETGGVADDPHGNGAHDPDFLPKTDYDPPGDIDFNQLLLNNPHDNAAHSETFLTDAYDPSTDLNFPSILEQTGNKHDNAAHNEDYLPLDRAFAPDTRSEIHRVTDVTQGANTNNLYNIAFDSAFPSRPSVQVELNSPGTGQFGAEQEVRKVPVVTDANDGVLVQVENASSVNVTFDIEVFANGPRSRNSSFSGTTHTQTETQQ